MAETKDSPTDQSPDPRPGPVSDEPLDKLATTQAPVPEKTRFFGVRTLPSGREAVEFKQIFDEILPHLKDGSLSVRVEIEADKGDGYSAEVRRTVSENASTLKFDQFGFEG